MSNYPQSSLPPGNGEVVRRSHSETEDRKRTCLELTSEGTGAASRVPGAVLAYDDVQGIGMRGAAVLRRDTQGRLQGPRGGGSW